MKLALEFLNIYLGQQKSYFPECSIQRGELYNSLGKLYMESKNLKKAFLYHQKALEIKLQVLGDLHLSTAKAYNDLA